MNRNEFNTTDNAAYDFHMIVWAIILTMKDNTGSNIHNFC